MPATNPLAKLSKNFLEVIEELEWASRYVVDPFQDVDESEITEQHRRRLRHDSFVFARQALCEVNVLLRRAAALIPTVSAESERFLAVPLVCSTDHIEDWDPGEIANELELVKELVLRVSEVLNSSAGQRNVREKEQRHEVGRLPIPDGTTWDDVSIRFTSEQRVQVLVRKISIESRNYAEMGFEDRRSRKPNAAWLFLLRFGQNRGMIRTGQDAGIEWRKVEKRVQELRQHLENLFGIRTDPFYTSRGGKGYRTRFRIEYGPSFDS